MRNVVRVLGPLLLFGVAWGWASSEAGFAVVVPKLVGLAKPGSLLADAKEAPAAAAHLLAALPWYGLMVFGCYALMDIGSSLMAWTDCPKESEDLYGKGGEIEQAKADLKKLGVRMYQ